MGRVVSVTDAETALGFRLAGIEARVAENPDEMRQGIESILAEREVRVALLDEQLFRQLPEPLKRKIEDSVSPIFMPIPTLALREGAIRPEEYVIRLIRRAIGYQIKIRR